MRNVGTIGQACSSVDDPMRLRFPDVAARASHYESVYVVLSHPTRPQAAWIRTTVKHRSGGAVTGALWVTWFSEDGVRAGRSTTSGATGRTRDRGR